MVGIGELLWDMLPDGRLLGGAPANFAYVASVLGNRAAAVSRLGDDMLGEEARERCSGLGLEVSHIQTDSAHPTGTVKVLLDELGQPSFEFVEGVAWDFLEWNDDLHKLATKADVVCFGSLAQRRDVSRTTIQRFVRATRESCLRIFDVNLRQSLFTPVILKTGFAMSTVAKLNHDELPVVMQAVGLPTTNEDAADCEMLLDHFGLEIVALTRGAHGSFLVSKKARSEHPGFRVKVVDTIGAGDAFTAAMAHQLRRGASLDMVNELANRVASWVASNAGATPEANPEMISRILGNAQAAIG
jgi:fructokinase